MKYLYLNRLVIIKELRRCWAGAARYVKCLSSSSQFQIRTQKLLLNPQSKDLFYLTIYFLLWYWMLNSWPQICETKAFTAKLISSITINFGATPISAHVLLRLSAQGLFLVGLSGSFGGSGDQT